MTPRRLQILNYIGFVWDAMDSRCRWDDDGWMRMFEELTKYKEKHSNCLVPRKYEGNPKLGNGVSNQRKHLKYKKKGKSTQMTAECICKLEEIGFDMNAVILRCIVQSSMIIIVKPDSFPGCLQ
eukprot:CAMPEP_0196814026 /NCGR_PEP_ID=MMETSP1362-20130617/40882_1 /TAXON_ID=163516 /ORGANISM="Leptocylindrus danicus, Strain CCMP1856" /LENGTH=123 /DNA_ID=CAMNT_0042190511 /DNA_START=515 /DNA_END=886 /DNA_ORIENTATION=-